MAFYRRRLPHAYEMGQPVFLTWCLHDSLPRHRVFPKPALNSGEAFVAMDRLLDEARAGAFYLRQPDIADMIVEAIHYNAGKLEHLSPSCVRGHAQSRSSAGHSMRGIAQASQIFEGHHSQARQCDVELDGTAPFGRRRATTT